MLNDIMDDASERMSKTIDALHSDLTGIRTGRASTSLVDKLMIDYYGTPTPLQQIASVTVPEAQMLVIRPFTPGDIAAIEKAITISDIGITPNSDGQQIRLTIPPLTEERRRDLTKQVNKRAEEAKVSVRNIRRDAISDLRDYEKEGLLTEDDLKLGQDKIQVKTDEFITLVEDAAKTKDEEIMTL